MLARWFTSSTATKQGKQGFALALRNCKSAADVDACVLNTPMEEFNGQNCAAAFISYAHHRSKSEPVLKRLMELSSNKDFDGWQLSNIAFVLTKLPHVENKLPDFLSKQIIKQADKLSAPYLSSTMLVLAKNPAVPKEVMERLRAAVSSRQSLTEFGPQELGNVVWSLATMTKRKDNDQQMKRICDLTVAELEARDLKHFHAHSLINIMGVFADFDYPCPKHILDKITTEFLLGEERDLAKNVYHPHRAANLAHAVAKLGCDDAIPLLTKLCNEIFLVQTMENYSEQSLSRILCAFASKGYCDQPKLNEKFARLFVNKLGVWTDPQVIADTLYALVQLGVASNTAPLCNKLFFDIKPKVFDPQTITNIVYSFAKLYYKHAGDKLRMFSREIQTNTSKYTSQQLVVCLRAFADLEINGKAMNDAICNELVARRFDGLNTPDFANLLRACDLLGVWKPHFFRALVDAMLSRNVFSECTNLELVRYAGSLAGLGVSQHPQVIDAIAQQALHRFNELAPEQIVTLLWSFACWDVLHTNAQVRSMLRMPVERPAVMLCNDIVATQLFQIRLACKQVGLSEEMDMVDTYCSDDWIATELASFAPSPSRTQENIARILQQRVGEQEQIQLEAVIAGGISVDIFLPARSLAIEVDGAKHFLANRTTQTGRTKFKHRLLEREGIRVISLKAEWFNQKQKNLDWESIVDKHVKL